MGDIQGLIDLAPEDLDQEEAMRLENDVGKIHSKRYVNKWK